MSAIDTNILVRFIVRDDASQCDKVNRLIRIHAELGEPIAVPVTVVLELEWVLRARFKFSKEAVLSTFDMLMAAEEIGFESLLAVKVALFAYRQCSADFADCLHLALVAYAGECPMLTFDRKAAQMNGSRLLSSELLDDLELLARQSREGFESTGVGGPVSQSSTTSH